MFQNPNIKSSDLSGLTVFEVTVSDLYCLNFKISHVGDQFPFFKHIFNCFG